jgi:Protein of unknown function (DUF3039)
MYVTVSKRAMNLSALALRSSSLLVSSAKSGTGGRVAAPGTGYPGGVSACTLSAGTTAPAPAPVIAPVVAPVQTPVESPVPIDTDGGDHDRFAHYARKDDVARAYVTGEAITALCGKKWVPTRDPSRYPICPTCVERKAAGWKL